VRFFHSWAGGTFLKELLPPPDNRVLLRTPKENIDLNLSAVTLSIWSFRTPIASFGTKELYKPGLPTSPRSVRIL